MVRGRHLIILRQGNVLGMSQFSSPQSIIQDWIKSRADAGVVLAQAVSRVTVEGSHMTIHIAPEEISRSKEWSEAIRPYKGALEDFYATEFGWLNSQAAYLRENIKTLEVIDTNGNPVGNLLDTGEYQRRKNPSS